MKQEDKELLLRDLCGRLPYGVKIDVIYSKDSGSSLRARLCSEGINVLDTNILWLFQQSEIYIKPYLFPMSEMTRKQLHEIQGILGDDCEIENDFIRIINSDRNTLSYQEINAVFNYCYKHNLDINRLIPKGLAIDATGLNIY